MLFAIRDDDTCFYTKPDELESAYSFIRDGCISLSVVPDAFPYHKAEAPYGNGFEPRCTDVAENGALIDQLSAGIKNGRYEIMLHGYSHEYRQIDNVWKPELVWKDTETIRDEVRSGKTRLEETFNTKVRVYVAPGNVIGPGTISALEDNGLHYSGIIEKSFNRKRDIFSLRNYIHRSIYKMIYGIPYGGCYRYGRHDEIYAYPLKSMEFLKKAYRLCKRQGHPMIIYTHYWKLLKDPDDQTLLKRFCEFAIGDGAKLVSVSECFDAAKHNSRKE